MRGPQGLLAAVHGLAVVVQAAREERHGLSGLKGGQDAQVVLDAIDDLRDASLAMMRDIQRSDAKQPKQLMNELFGI